MNMHFKSVKDLSRDIYNSFNMLHERYKEKPYIEEYSISLIAYYDDVIKVLNYLVKDYDFQMVDICIESECTDNYFHEWLLTVDSEKQIFVEKAICEKKSDKDKLYYYKTYDDIIYIDDNSDASLEFLNQNVGIDTDSHIIKYLIEEEKSNSENEVKKQEHKESCKKETKSNKTDQKEKNKEKNKENIWSDINKDDMNLKYSFKVKIDGEPTLNINTKEFIRDYLILCKYLKRNNFDLFTSIF